MSNLIPGQHKLTVEEQSEGGKKSVEVRRQRRKARDIAETIFSMPLHSVDTVKDLEDIRSLDDIRDTDSLTEVLASIVKKASTGSVPHAKFLLTLTGDYSDKVSLQTPRIDDETLEDLDRIYAEMEDYKESTSHKQTEVFCQVNKYTYGMYHDPTVFKDFSLEDLESLLDGIYTYGISQTETWGKPLDRGTLIDHIRKQIADRTPQEDARSVDEILTRTAEKVRNAWESER